MLGPTRRNIRLSPSLDAAANKPKRHETGLTLTKHNQPRLSKLQRLPFFVWVLLIFLYCYIMLCTHRSFLMSTSHNANAVQQTMQRSTPTVINSNQNRIVHVIQTRFMQHQSHLLELGFARLVLFETFCLPSMLEQTSQNFVWIIRVDPSLNEEIIGKMRQLVGGRENILLLGSNHNPEGMGRDNADFERFLGLERNKPQSTGMVLSGNVTLVRGAFERSAASYSSVLLETRLDADDALHMMFVELIQNQAKQYLMRNYVGGEPSDQIWRLWCIHSIVEWHPLNPYPVSTDEASTDDKSNEEGYLLMFSDRQICATPGLTFGYGFAATRSSIVGGNRLKHNDIVGAIAQCDNGVEVKCASRLTELSPGALRARTATSAGMVNIITGDDLIDQSSNGLKQKSNKQLKRQFFQQGILWKGVGRLFSVTKSSARETRSFIVSRMKYIAADNLRGLCTPGHSCKENGKAVLNAIIKN
jgi:hypothetical protein